jgi:hypothetical protein
MPWPTFRESTQLARPLRELQLSIEGTPLERVIEEFRGELREAEISGVEPGFYLSTEWGVPFGSVMIAIPFYLAHPELVLLHEEHSGHVEGSHRGDILRYLRHEMGHVVNYAYRLYEREEWVTQFGSMSQPYLEEYRPQPFSRRFVNHLPGWYAQKHPDEDWSETFAVWMTPGRRWREEHADSPTALAKLELCERLMREVRGQPPVVQTRELDEDVNELTCSLQDLYASSSDSPEAWPGLDGDLRAIFEDLQPDDPDSRELRSAAQLIRAVERDLMATVFRWTGHFPERIRRLLRRMAERAAALQQGYSRDQETQAIIGLTVLVTSLAMNHVHSGSYVPVAMPPGSGADPAPDGSAAGTET